MKKDALFLLPALCAFAIGCNKPEGGTNAAGSSSASTTTTTTSSQQSAAGAIVDKALSFLGASGPFEGEITMNATDPGKPAKSITYEVKGTKLRFEAPENNGPMA